MRRLLTGYVVSFNRRHKRHGHLFQIGDTGRRARKDYYSYVEAGLEQGVSDA